MEINFKKSENLKNVGSVRIKRISSSSFERVLAVVKHPLGCLSVLNCQAMQSMGRSMDWTLEDNMVDGCSSAPHSQDAEEVIPHLYKQERKRPTRMWKQFSRTYAVLETSDTADLRCSWESHSRSVVADVGDESMKPRSVVQPLRLRILS